MTFENNSNSPVTTESHPKLLTNATEFDAKVKDVETYFNTTPQVFKEAICTSMVTSQEWKNMACSLSPDPSSQAQEDTMTAMMDIAKNARIYTQSNADFTYLFPKKINNKLPSLHQRKILNIELLPDLIGDNTYFLSANLPPLEWLNMMYANSRWPSTELSEQHFNPKSVNLRSLSREYFNLLRQNVIGPGIQSHVYFKLKDVEGEMPKGFHDMLVEDINTAFLVKIPLHPNYKKIINLAFFHSRNRIHHPTISEDGTNPIDVYKQNLTNSLIAPHGIGMNGHQGITPGFSQVKYRKKGI